MKTEGTVGVSTIELLDRFRNGDRDAAMALVALFYNELRRIAAAHLRGESPGHTLQPTALVNELYCKISHLNALSTSEVLPKDVGSARDFFGLARYLMAQILIEHARFKNASRRRHIKVQLDETQIVQTVESGQESDVLRALDGLEAQDPELRRLIDLRFFCGHSIAETAKLLGIGQTKVKADWRLAKVWLQRELGELGKDFEVDEDSLPSLESIL